MTLRTLFEISSKRIARWGAIVVKYNQKKSLNSLETVLLAGLEQELERLGGLNPEERLNLTSNAEPEDVIRAYETIVVNYQTKNYAKHDASVVKCAEAVLTLLEEAKNSLIGVKQAEEEQFSSELTEMAFAATQITDDLAPEVSHLEDAGFKRSDAPGSAVLPPPSSVPPPHFNHPPTPSYGFGSQDLPRGPALIPPPGTAPLYANSPRPYQNVANNYPPSPSWDLPPPRPGNPLHSNTNLPGGPVSPAYAPPPRTGDLPPIANQQDPRLRELSHRLYSAESRMRVMDRTHQERITLLESQLGATEFRAQQAERRANQLEAALNETRRMGSNISPRPVSPAR